MCKQRPSVPTGRFSKAMRLFESLRHHPMAWANLSRKRQQIVKTASWRGNKSLKLSTNSNKMPRISLEATRLIPNHLCGKIIWNDYIHLVKFDGLISYRPAIYEQKMSKHFNAHSQQISKQANKWSNTETMILRISPTNKAPLGDYNIWKGTLFRGSRTRRVKLCLLVLWWFIHIATGGTSPNMVL